METLTHIAAELRAEAAEKGQAQHALEGGLTLTLCCRGQTYSLSLTRQYQQASQTERQTCRAAFGVPEWVGPQHITITYERGWGIWRVEWSENRGAKIRRISQAHLDIGLSAWWTLLEKYNCTRVSDWDRLSDAELDEMIKEIIDGKSEHHPAL